MTELQKLLHKLGCLKFKNNDLKKIIMALCEKEYQNINSVNYHTEYLQSFSVLKDCECEDFEWNTYKHIICKAKGIRPLLKLLIYLTEIDFLPNEIKNEYIEAKEQLMKISNKQIHRVTLTQAEYPHAIYFYREDKSIVINTKSIEMLELLIGFIKNTSHHICKSKKAHHFFAHFEISLGKNKLSNITDINYSAFKAQYTYFKESNSLSSLFYFYQYIVTLPDNKVIFPNNSGILNEALQRSSFSLEYSSGYKAYYYNPLEATPLTDKWILFNSEDYKTNHEKTSILHGQSVDFSMINSEYYRTLVKDWIWLNTGASLKTKINQYYSVVKFLNFISDRHEIQNQTIGIDDVLIYKNHLLSTFNNDNTIKHSLTDIRTFLNLYIDTNKIHVDKNTLSQLTHAVKASNTATSIPDEELNKIANKMKEKTYESIDNNLYFVLFYLLIATEMRVSHLLSLEKDNIKETVKKNQYVLDVRTKTSGTFKVETAITKDVKMHLESVIQNTELLRNECSNDAIKNRIFLKRNNRRKLNISPMSSPDFNEYLKSICKELNIAPYTSENLRDTHMTKSLEYSISKGLHKLSQSVLTGHKTVDTTERHYLDEDITDMLMLLYQSSIGDIEIAGIVLPEGSVQYNDKNMVENGCGACKRASCNDDSYFTCLMCNEFATTVDRKKFFDEKLREIDHKLKSQKYRHDVEDLNAKKQLLLAYLKEIYIIESRTIGVNHV